MFYLVSFLLFYFAVGFFVSGAAFAIVLQDALKIKTLWQIFGYFLSCLLVGVGWPLFSAWFFLFFPNGSLRASARDRHKEDS